MKFSPGNLLAMTSMALLLSSCGSDSNTQADTTNGQNAVLIKTQQATIVDLPIWLQTVGKVRSVSAPTLAAEVDGRVINVLVDTGDSIEVGQPLAETDTSTLELQLDAAKAALERLQVHISNGERRVDRFEQLSAKNLSSQTQLDDAREQLEAFEADYKAAEAQLALVQDSLTKSRIMAPVSGVIQQRFIAEGDFVKRGQPLFEITRPELLQAWLPFPESVALQIRIGQPARIFSPLMPGESIDAEVTELQPSLGDGSRAVMAIINLQDPGLLRPSATLTGKVLVETRQSVVMVPNMSVVQRPVGNVVYVIKDNRAEARRVTTGNEQGTQVEIRSGLTGGEVVATEGAAFLTDGAAVTIRES